MTEHKLSESEIQEIREEAEKYMDLYKISENDLSEHDILRDVYASYIAALTRERERVKGLVEVLEWTLKIIQPYTPHQIREIKMRMKETLNNYNQNKEV